MNDPTPNHDPPMIPASGTNPAPGRKLGWWIHLLLIAALPVLVAILGLGHSPGRGPALTHSASGLLYVCAIQLGIFAVICGLAWLGSRASTDELLLRWRPGFWVIPLGIGYSVLLRIALAIIGLVVVGTLLAMQIVNQKDLEKFTQMNAPDVGALVDVSALRQDPVYLFLTLTVVSFLLGGLREEIWRSAFLAGFRRLWPRCFEGRRGEMKAVLLAAVIFGAAHIIQGPVAMVLTGLLGVGLGAIMVWHRSIWPAVMAHGFFDATSIALIPLLADQLQKVKDSIGH